MATLVSLNVGLPKNVSWQDRTVHSGIWKEPVDGPRMVRRLDDTSSCFTSMTPLCA
jgi:hypothetical protein